MKPPQTRFALGRSLLWEAEEDFADAAEPGNYSPPVMSGSFSMAEARTSGGKCV